MPSNSTTSTPNSVQRLPDGFSPWPKQFTMAYRSRISTMGHRLIAGFSSKLSLLRGFDFLGFNVRKYHGKLLIKPARKNVLAFLADLRCTIKSKKSISSGELIRLLNPKLRGWANYYRHVVSKQTFSYVDHHVFQATWKWSTRRHPNKPVDWVKRKYFRREGSRNWVFGGQTVDRNGAVCLRTLVHASDTAIRRHIKVRSDANPYSSLDAEYLANRTGRRFHYYLSRVAPLRLSGV